jgi:hypothetical protein
LAVGEDEKRDALEREARIHRIAGWVIFLALLFSTFLPNRYSLFMFAFPFGMVAVAVYFVRFRTIANLESGLVLLAIIVALQAAAILKSGFDRREINREIERIACRSDLADRAGDELCDEIFGALYPEPEPSIE